VITEPEQCVNCRGADSEICIVCHGSGTMTPVAYLRAASLVVTNTPDFRGSSAMGEAMSAVFHAATVALTGPAVVEQLRRMRSLVEQLAVTVVNEENGSSRG
jgi:hypothetical protein